MSESKREPTRIGPEPRLVILERLSRNARRIISLKSGSSNMMTLTWEVGIRKMRPLEVATPVT